MIWNKNKKCSVHPIVYIYVGVFIFVIILIVTNSSLIVSKINKEKNNTHIFDSLPIKAKSVYVYDVKEDSVIYAKNEHTPLPLASITKVMSSYCALKNSNVEEVVLVPRAVFDLSVGTTTSNDFELWTIRDLAIYTLIESSNLGSEVLAENTLGINGLVECMNRSVEEMGLFETKFFNVSGLDIDADRSGAYGSSENVATMFQNVYREFPEILGTTAYDSYDIYSQNGIMRTALNTNIVSNGIVRMLASKTGFTDLSGGNLVFMMNAGLQRRVVVVILGSTQQERFTDALVISEAIVESFSK